MAKWSLEECLNEIPSTFSLPLHPLITQILMRRGLASEADIQKFIAPNYETDSLDPFLFHDMEKVVARVAKAKETGEKVVIYGDYDADGITSSAILKETFELLAIDASVYIPDKRSEGYGLNEAAIQSFKQDGVALIITVDCGITNHQEIEIARQLSIDVIVTDHHHVPPTLPEAYAVINPHYEHSGYPFIELAGVGVAFKVVQALFQRLLPEKVEQTKWMLDLVAIGTIADCVPLVGENRVFVKYGLLVLSKTRRVGLKQLFTVGRIQIDEQAIPDTKKVSFYVAPRINAAGRINHANLAYNLVIEKDPIKAREHALDLESNNTQRQKTTEQIVNEVRKLAQENFADKKFIYAVSEHYSVGVIGLVAGKIAQEFNKPTAIFQKGDVVSKGSFRSIPQINIIETIGECGELLAKFGGHAQAAGVSVSNENMEAFFEKMNGLIEQQLEGVDLSEEIHIDALLDASHIDFDLLDGIELMKPFGEGNAEPIFLIKDLVVREKKIVGNGNKHMKLLLSPSDGSPKVFDAISFNGAQRFSDIMIGDSVDLVHMIQKDEWNGNKKIQFIFIDAKKSHA